MKGFLHVALLFLFISQLNGQSDISWGPYERNIFGASTEHRFLGVVGNYYFLLAQVPQKRTLLQYTLDHQLVSKKEINDFGKNREVSFQNIIKTSKDTFFYIHEYIDKHKEWVLYKCDYQNGTFSKPTEVHYDTYKDLNRRRLLQSMNAFQTPDSDGGMYLSPDSNYVAFVNIIEPTDYRQDDVISVSVFDSKMRQEWFISYDYKISRQGFELEDIIVSNEGKVYILGAVNRKIKTSGKTKSIRQKNLPRYDYYVFRVDQSSIEETVINIDSHLAVVEAGFFIAGGNSAELAVSGFYTDGEKRNEVDGVFIQSLSYDLEPLNTELNDFSDKVKKMIPANVNIEEWLDFKDGSFAFIAEDSYIRTSTANDNFGTFNNRFGQNQFNRIDFFHTNDLIIISFDKSKALKEIQVVPRRFDSRAEELTSFSVVRTKTKNAIVFNDYKTRKEAKEIGRKGRIFTDILIFSEGGKIDYQTTLFTDREVDAFFAPNMIGSDGEEVIFSIYDTRDISSGRLRLD